MIRDFEEAQFVFVSSRTGKVMGRVERRLLRVMIALLDRKAGVHLISAPRSPLQEAAASAGVEVAPYHLDKLNVARTRSRIRKYLERHRPLAIHSMGYDADMLARWAAKGLPTAAVNTITCSSWPRKGFTRRFLDSRSIANVDTFVADCRTLVEAARDHAGVVWVGLEYRYMPPVARLIDEVRAGAIGTLRMLSIREHRFPFLHKVGDWNRFTANTGGTLVEKCCHHFDLMNLIVGERPVRVMASGGQDVNHLDEVYDGRRSDILDNAFVIVEYGGGVRTLLDLSMFAEASRNSEELVAVGDAGKVEALIPDDIVRIGRRGTHWHDVEEHHVVDDRIAHTGLHHGSSYLEHVGLLDAIRTGGEPEVSLEDGMLAVAIGAAAHRSIDDGRPVEVAELLDP
jgi:predicted dehydrogenase